MNKTLNVPYLVRLVVIGAVLAAGVYLLHRRQAGRQADAYLRQADAAEQQGQLTRAVGFLRRFLVLRSNQPNEMARLALLTEQTAKTREDLDKAFYELERVLREDPARDDVRRRDIAVAMLLGRFGESQSHIDFLIAKHPEDGALHDLKGQCLWAAGETAAAEKAFSAATESQPDLIIAYRHRTELLRRQLDQPKVADAAIQTMLQKNPNSAAAHLAAADYWRLFGTAEQIAKNVPHEVEEAERCAPDDLEVILAIATLAGSRADELTKAKDTAGSRKELEKACQRLRKGIEQGLPALSAVPAPAERDRAMVQQRVLAGMFMLLMSFETRLDQTAEAESTASQGIDVLPGYPELRVRLADLYILQKKWDEASKQLEALEVDGYPLGDVGYRRGRILAGQGKWLDARKALESAAEEATQSPAVPRQTQYLLANCYDRIGLIDRRDAAYRKARPDDPRDELWYPVSMQIAAGLVESGRPREAIQLYEVVAGAYGGAQTPLARVLFQEILRAPATERNWRPVENALTQAVEDADREILRADLLRAKNQPDEARAVLKRAAEKFPDSVDVPAAQAFIEALQGDEALATQMLDQAEKKFGDRVVIRLTRARLVASGKAADTASQLERLGGGLEKFSPEDRRRLLQAMTEFAKATSSQELVDRLYDRLTTEMPDNLGIHLVRFDRAVQRNDEPALLKAKEEIARVEGSAGSSVRTAEALYLIWLARQKNESSGLTRASELLAAVGRERPSWSRIPLAEGVIFDLNKKPAPALEKYSLAYDLGERNPEFLKRLFELYYQQKRIPEANRILKQLSERVVASGRFQQMAAEVLVQEHRTGDIERALQLAKQEVPDDCKDYDKLMWLSRIRWVAQHRREVEKPLRQAIEIDPARPDAWIALVQFLVSADRKADAEKTLEEAKGRIGAADAPLAIAQCYEVMGELDHAGAVYEQALKARPNDLHILKNAASLQLRIGGEKGLAKARELLEAILENNQKTDDDKLFAKRLLAITLAAGADYDTKRHALEVLDLLDPQGLPKPLSGTETAEEIRTRAVAFALQRDLRSKREAIRLLEEFWARQPLRDDDRFLLAQLYLGVGEWPNARRVLAALLRTADDNPMYVATYAFGLIREPDLAEAEKWVAKLEKAQPDAPRAIELRARLLAAAGDLAKARDLILKHAEQPDAQLLFLAQLLEEIGDGAAAEPLYLKRLAADKRPRAALSIAAYYGRQDRADKALDLCDPAWKTVGPEEVSGTCVEILYAARSPRPDQIGRVATRLEAALRASPSSIALLSNLAALRNLQGDYPGAIAAYRDVVALDARNVIALNNLAFLLSASAGKHDDALAELERAKKAVGPLPTLLDTEAQICLRKGNATRAISLLSEQVLVLKPRASYYFHLAQAYHAEKKKPESRIAWNRAQKLKLTPADLHPLERDDYRVLAAYFAKP
ncbi:MAG: tetratricopeptide repeat protein [Gemmataceae bacterium]